MRQAAGGSWALEAGTYWLTFAGSEGGGDLIGAISPNPLGNEAFSSGGQWNANDGLNMALRVQGTFGAIPEPGTWTMMLVGLGAIGASMRRRRRITAIAQMA